MQLYGSTVLLTGASGGIGRATARTLDARGAKVLLNARRGDVLEEIRAELGGRPECLAGDLSESWVAADLAERAGPVDVLVANAALPASGALDGFEPEQIDRALDVNLRAPIQLTRALLPGMLERGRGHVVLVSSLAGKLASSGSSLYSATKFGLRGFASGLRQDVEQPRGGRDRGVPGLRLRRRHVRRGQGRAAPLRGHPNARAGGGRGGARNRGEPARARRGPAEPAGERASLGRWRRSRWAAYSAGWAPSRSPRRSPSASAPSAEPQ